MFEQEAMREHPNECCAIVYNDKLHITKNAATDKRAAFLIPRLKMLEAYKSNTGLQRVIHSHTMTNEQPSEQDLQGMRSTNCPWSIYSTMTKAWYHSDEDENEGIFPR
ncbi:JAB domain-containing protein [Vibrio crassostreae]|uniref:JAB domain-containing protein n=1 Tax=Vibrio crassostreae TaxID=246167 RepID=A0A822MWL0_9VIBR|nr:Mov34/MPN/PAD-1 family protein [Vibrio crassostreae]CAH6958345.1 JAB domain-containing protein similar to deubiquitination enzymes [Vibrio chagasii]MDH5950424.1 Mov34/MPN/PAD-1 family protein [Vibrio crassostreae]TCN06135.1 JAB domain-containing protein similar to deubiquitination enzymes [Vibrio crassostreae]TCU05454.1 JAB domain-containing protein similar to deubiquitination enzymes [Vibrio crassostreae]CAH7287952.1 JAB domain-containing protein similar to deubiquitination enzymes [Vibrio